MAVCTASGNSTFNCRARNNGAIEKCDSVFAQLVLAKVLSMKCALQFGIAELVELVVSIEQSDHSTRNKIGIHMLECSGAQTSNAT